MKVSVVFFICSLDESVSGFEFDNLVSVWRTRAAKNFVPHIDFELRLFTHSGQPLFLRTTYTDMNLFMITSTNSDWLILWSAAKAANFFVILASSAARTTNGTFAWECMRIESAKTVLNKHNHILGRELLCPNLGESLEMESAYGGILTHSLLPRRGSPKLRDTEMYFRAHIFRNARGVRIICD